MNDSENKYIIGLGRLVTNVESFTIKKIIFSYKLLKKLSVIALSRLKELLKFLFNRENRRTTLITILISLLIIKILQIIINLFKAIKIKNHEIALKEKENDVSINESSKQIQDKEDVYKNETNNVLIYYTLDLENKKKKLIKENIQKIKNIVGIQNKMRDKLNLPKESINTPFYSILKLYIINNFNKN